MTQQDLAEKVGVTRQTIMSMEKGKYSPTLELAFKIAEVFNKNLADIFTYKKQENKKGLKVRFKKQYTLCWPVLFNTHYCRYI